MASKLFLLLLLVSVAHIGFGGEIEDVIDVAKSMCGALICPQPDGFVAAFVGADCCAGSSLCCNYFKPPFWVVVIGIPAVVLLCCIACCCCCSCCCSCCRKQPTPVSITVVGGPTANIPYERMNDSVPMYPREEC